LTDALKNNSFYTLNEGQSLLPVSLYAATKKSNELMVHVYSKLYQLPTTGLRFFTVLVHGADRICRPRLFADAIMHDKVINVFNAGAFAHATGECAKHLLRHF
jgi:nucleoside-diphosphate-sugar epimerase